MYKFLYILFIISIVLFGSIYIGPATPRQYMSVIMAVCIVFSLPSFKRIDHSVVLLYLLFILFYGISSYMEGSIDSFNKELVGRYAVSIVGFYATVNYFNKNHSFNSIINTFFILGIINSIVTLLQYFGNPIGIKMGAFFLDISNEVKYYQFQHMVEDSAGNALFGLLGDPVINGYFSMIIPLIILHKCFSNKTEHGLIDNRLLLWPLWALSLFALFVIQERSAFYITGLLSFVFIYHHTSSRTSSRLLLLFIVVVALFSLPGLLSSDLVRNSRYFGVENVRSRIFMRSLSFIRSNLLFGGLRSAVEFIGTLPHNVVLSGLIYGGIFGGVLVVIILIKQFHLSYKLYRSDTAIGIAFCFLGYTLNGFVHNPSIVTGEALLWILWAMAYSEFYKGAMK